MGTKRHKSRYVDLTGMRFCHWTVVGRAKKRPYNGTYWVCQCDCGNTSEVDGKHLKNGRSTNCGCSNRRKKFHGLMGKEPRLSQTWSNMMSRCYRENNPNYKHYGGRGIRVCEEWHDLAVFVKWAYENGYKKDAPRGAYTIDRIDVNGNYEPDNCRWTTMKEQRNNTRSNLYLNAYGVTGTAAQWAKILNIHPSTVARWVHRYGLEKAEKVLVEHLEAC